MIGRVLIPLLMAMINIPYFPANLNVGAFGFCCGIGVAGLIYEATL